MAIILPIDKHKSPPSPQDSQLDQDMHHVDRIISDQCQSNVPMSRQIVQHVIASGGKRLRPKLVLAAAYLCGYQDKQHYALAACIECIHNATLLHDDVVDESLVRRGTKAAHTIWGNKSSILVGDFLLAKAFGLVIDSQQHDILKSLSLCASHIAEGEIRQLANVGNLESTENLYIDIIKAKTARLFATACQIGAQLTDKNDALQQALESFGMNLGIAFQLTDDVLDYRIQTDTLHKPAGNDFFEKKITLPVILAYRRGNDQERLFWKNCMQKSCLPKDDLLHAVQLIHNHQADKDSIQRAKHYATMAKDSLDLFPPNVWKDIMLAKTDECILRTEKS